MEIARVECDNERCRAPMNGSGYYLSHETVIGGIRMAIIKGEHNPPGDWQHHYCGKACLMLALNEIVEEINNSAQGTVPDLRPETSGVESGLSPQKEEDHEDNLGI